MWHNFTANLKSWRFLALVLGCLSFAPVATAQSVQVLGDFRAWSSYSASDGGGLICFAVSKPELTEPVPDDYDEAHFYVVHRLSDSVRFELNLIAGYEFAQDSLALLRIGSRAFDMYTQGDAAWLADTSLSADVAGYIRAGSAMEIEGTSNLGVKIVQKFSLSGATAAQRAIDSAC